MAEDNDLVMNFDQYPQFRFCNPVCYDSLVIEVGIDWRQEIRARVLGVYDEAFHWANVKPNL